MKLVKKLLLMVVLTLSIGVSAGGVGPWPFGKETKFPWRMIPGTWQVDDVNQGNVFSFKTTTNANGEKELKIYLVHLDPCHIIAEGRGVLNGRFITAQMLSAESAFNLTIHAFNLSDVSETNSKESVNRSLRSDSTSDKVLAVRIFPIGEPEKVDTFQITKVSSPGTPVCKQIAY